jgi:hypothetical protein
LPTDLAASLAILNETEFDRLLAGVLREASRRQKPVKTLSENPAAAPVKATRQEQKPEGVTQAKVNLVRAAFKAGVKPAAISRQFGLSQAAIRQVLRSEETTSRASASEHDPFTPLPQRDGANLAVAAHDFSQRQLTKH